MYTVWCNKAELQIHLSTLPIAKSWIRMQIFKSNIIVPEYYSEVQNTLKYTWSQRQTRTQLLENKFKFVSIHLPNQRAKGKKSLMISNKAKFEFITEECL